jgi:AraC family transcriptional regulator
VEITGASRIATHIKHAPRDLDTVEAVKADTKSFYRELVQATIERIAGDLDEALDLGALARAAGLSPFHFHRVFRGMVGETPLELARRLRMERAAWQLSRTGDRVTDIAFSAGYDTHEAFTRAFKACFSTSPSGFREKHYRRTGLPAPCGIHYCVDGAIAAFVARDSGGQHMQVEIADMPEMRVASVHHVGPYNQVAQAFERLGSIAGPAGLFAQPGAAMVGLYYDDPESTPQEELRADAGIVIPPATPLPAGLTEQRLPAGRYAKVIHRGSYEQLGDTWARLLGEWLPASGHRIGSTPSFELYRNTPMDTPKEQLVTEIYAPLA